MEERQEQAVPKAVQAVAFPYKGQAKEQQYNEQGVMLNSYIKNKEHLFKNTLFEKIYKNTTRKKRMKKSLIALIAIAILVLGAGIYYKITQVTSQPEKTYCTPESRQGEFCTAQYDPVCGWFNQSVQCITYPCANVYSNNCHACLDTNVDYWTQGVCPSSA